jgi:hypothetical protein
VTDLLALLQAFHQEKLEMFLRHQAAARLVRQYDINNTYQYILNREDTQLSWLAAAIGDLGGEPAGATESGPRARAGTGDAAHLAIEEDARDARAFVERWRSQVEAVSHARHRSLLRVVLGETLESLRFFEQAASGRVDLLGRRGPGLGPAHGEVLSSRWVG